MTDAIKSIQPGISAALRESVSDKFRQTFESFSSGAGKKISNVSPIKHHPLWPLVMQGLSEPKQANVNHRIEQAIALAKENKKERKERLIFHQKFKDSTLEFFPMRPVNEDPLTNSGGKTPKRFYASIHPSKSSVCNYLNQIHKSGGAIMKLAETEEGRKQDVECPEYFNTDHKFKLIGDMWVKGEPLGNPVHLGQNYGDRTKRALEDVTLQFYKISTASKKHPSDVHTTLGMHVDKLIDGSALRPGNLIALALIMANLPVDDIRIHCFAGLDRTMAVIVLSQFLQHLRTRTENTPIVTIESLIEKYRDDRGEPTAIQGKQQLAMLFNEAAHLERMSPAKLEALISSAGVPSGVMGHPSRIQAAR